MYPSDGDDGHNDTYDGEDDDKMTAPFLKRTFRNIPGQGSAYEVCVLLFASAAIAEIVCLFVGCLTSQQHASVSQGRICSDKFTRYHTEIEAADQTFHLTQSQYIDTGPTSPSADPITPVAWQGSHWSAIL